MSGGVELILPDTIEKVRSYIDDPDTGARFDDDWVLRHEIGSVIPDVVHRVRNWDSASLLVEFDFDGVEGQRFYKMPVGFNGLQKLETVDNEGFGDHQLLPRGPDHPYGWGYRLSQNYLEFEYALKAGTTYRAHYELSLDTALHQGTGTLNADGTFVLDQDPVLGALDRRATAYAGHLLRIRPTGRAPIVESVVSTHEWEDPDWVLTLRDPLGGVAAGDHEYEVVPWGVAAFWECVAIRAAIRLGGKLSISQKDQRALHREYLTTLKTAIERHEFRQARLPSRLRTDSEIAREYDGQRDRHF